MRIIKAEFIEFGDFVISNDRYPIAIVSGDYEYADVDESELDDADYDWIIPELYQGQVVFSR